MRLFPALLRRAAAVLAMVAIAGQAASAAPRALPVGRCLNLGNHLDTGDAQDKRLAAEDFHNIRAAGFTTVRLPVNWAKYSDPVGRGHGISPLWMARVSAMVDAALDAGLNVILDSHHFDALHGDPAAASPWLAALWYQIGWQLADRPTTRLWFEIDNEPSDRLTNANLMATLGPALAAIRQSNPDRPVLIGGENWSNVESLASLPLPADAHVYPTFHYYTPMGFTHQGASWVRPPQPAGRSFGTPADMARLAADAERVRQFIARTGRVPVLGETGVFTSVPLPQRAAYTRAVYQAFAPQGVGVCEWAYTNTFAFYDWRARQWLPGLLEAIGLKPGKAR